MIYDTAQHNWSDRCIKLYSRLFSAEGVISQIALFLRSTG